MAIADFLEILGMAIIGGLGGVLIFEVLYRIEKRKRGTR